MASGIHMYITVTNSTTTTKIKRTSGVAEPLPSPPVPLPCRIHGTIFFFFFGRMVTYMSRFSSTPLLMPFSDHLWSHLIEQQQHGDPFFIHNWPLCPHQQQGRLQVNFYWNQQVVGGWMVCSTPTQNDCSSKWVHGLVDVLFSILEKKKKKIVLFLSSLMFVTWNCQRMTGITIQDSGFYKVSSVAT